MQRLSSNDHLQRLFTEAFSAQDIAEPLPSFDADRPAQEIYRLMSRLDYPITGLRNHGKVVGYVRRENLEHAQITMKPHPFREGQVVPGHARLSDVIHITDPESIRLYSLLGDVVGVFNRSDINKPVMRMWPFGIITFLEMELLQLIKENYPEDTWQSLLSEGRLEKVQALHRERQRRGQPCPLSTYLQLSDKGQIPPLRSPWLAASENRLSMAISSF